MIFLMTGPTAGMASTAWCSLKRNCSLARAASATPTTSATGVGRMSHQ